MSETGSVVLDVLHDFPGGFPAEGDVIVVQPGRPHEPIALIRYPPPSYFAHLAFHLDRVECRHQVGCGGCPLSQGCPQRRPAMVRLK